MDKQTIQCIMEFMQRADLKGYEAPLFEKSMQALQAELNKQNVNNPEVKNGPNE